MTVGYFIGRHYSYLGNPLALAVFSDVSGRSFVETNLRLPNVLAASLKCKQNSINNPTFANKGAEVSSLAV